jgi:DNA-binding helix-hairpin-helix protein with protein kinase domain
MHLYDQTGKPVALGREIARGGEGAVFEITRTSEFAAKLYHSAVEKDKVAKLATMARLATPDLMRVAAWPTSTLHKVPGGEVVGIMMPLITGHLEIHQLYSPAQRKLHFPRADWNFLVHVAMNCAAAFETVHRCGHIIGDVNQSGVLVSDRATVKLIDCDSFQVSGNDRLFHCIVGVPQYTPPELQGRAFRGIERTREHDAFGLALLIFHLLFMGRHPFAGRFHGSGDMPIEKAISEGRFAFGPLAQKRQMAPPPHSLALAVLPPSIVKMFERAFAQPSVGIARPSATEWQQSMLLLKNSLKTCVSDHGHRYPSNLLNCPWCDIVRGGGPNFFISVQVIAGVHYDLPHFDVGGMWKSIEAIVRPSPRRPDYASIAISVTPDPLPENIQTQLLFLRLVRPVTLLAIIFGAAGTVFSELVKYIGLALAASFGTWWMILSLNSKLSSEIQRRRKHLMEQRAMLESEQEQWDRIAQKAADSFDNLKILLRGVATHVNQLRTDFERERREMDTRRREEQMIDFLDTMFLRDYQIEKIGQGRRATLLSYGIETAADVCKGKLQDIPGFGPKIIRKLLDWREQMERAFTFDASKPMPPDKMRALVLKYQQRQQTSKTNLEAGEKALRKICEVSTLELAASAERIRRLVGSVRKADADMSITQG